VHADGVSVTHAAAMPLSLRTQAENDRWFSNPLGDVWLKASDMEIAINRLVSAYPEPVSVDEKDALRAMTESISRLRKAIAVRRHAELMRR
jgi:hypothetical protein